MSFSNALTQSTSISRIGNPYGQRVSHVGVSVTMPRYVDVPWLRDAGISGLVGPVTTYAYNLQDKTHSLTLAGEIGISSLLSPTWILDAQVQPGATFVWDSTGELMPVIPHIGIFVIPGYRFPIP